MPIKEWPHANECMGFFHPTKLDYVLFHRLHGSEWISDTSQEGII